MCWININTTSDLPANLFHTQFFIFFFSCPRPKTLYLFVRLLFRFLLLLTLKRHRDFINFDSDKTSSMTLPATSYFVMTHDIFQSRAIYILIYYSLILGYASSSSGGAGLYNSNIQSGQVYGSKYPYSNQYTGYTSAGGSGSFPFYQPYAPLPPFATPYDFQNAFQQYYGQLSSFNAKYGWIVLDSASHYWLHSKPNPRLYVNFN